MIPDGGMWALFWGTTIAAIGLMIFRLIPNL